MKYYIEVNLICIIILVLFQIHMRQNRRVRSTTQMVYGWLLATTIVLCFSDMLAGIFRGTFVPGARVIIEVSNLIYYEALVLISYLWSVYVFINLRDNSEINHKRMIFRAIPMLAFSVIVMTNPFTNYLFSIDKSNLYERGPGVILHWVITWAYFLIATIEAVKRYYSEKSLIKKQEIVPIFAFVIAPTIASVIQMLFYGVTTTQVGITLSLVIICLTMQNTQILTDQLTGINNRRALDYYILDVMHRQPNAIYTVAMIDVNDFKKVNDQYGHIHGDQALQQVAEALKRTVGQISKRSYLCRYGGDEFLIVGCNNPEIEETFLRKKIQEELDKGVSESGLPCRLSASVGIANGKCSSEQDIQALLQEADVQMYNQKKNRINK